MSTPGFSGLGASLKEMQISERGTVNPFRDVDERTRIRLEEMGIRPGTLITVEQRSPRFTIRVGCRSVVLSDRMVHAVSVRLPRHVGRVLVHQRAIAAPIRHWRETFPACELNLP